MNYLIQTMMNRPLPSIGVTSSVSVTGAAVSFAENTFPLIQWAAAFVGLLSGLMGIAIAAWHIKNIIKKDFGIDE